MLSVSVDLSSLKLQFITDVSPELYADFSCERAELNQFLQEDAVYYHQQNLTRTTLVLQDDLVVGFFSLSADAIQLTPMEKGELALNGEYPIDILPAVKLTKLAIAQGFEGKGYGKAILDMIVGLVYDLRMAVRFVTVDAIASKVAFYERHGFVTSLFRHRQMKQTLKGEQPDHVLMHKDIYAE